MLRGSGRSSLQQLALLRRRLAASGACGPAGNGNGQRLVPAQRRRRLSTSQPPPPPPQQQQQVRPQQPGGGTAAVEEAGAKTAAEGSSPPPLPEVPVVEAPEGTSGYYRAAAIVFGVGTGYVVANWTDQGLSAFWPNPNRGGPVETSFSSAASVTNWSGTHHAEPARYYEPASVKELEALVKDAHAKGQKIRPVGTALSPNGLGLAGEGMVCLSQLDKVLEVDTAKRTITVEAGARVSQVLEALARHGLTLQNFSSIQEQQMGGWTQVAAHGTGASLPTVEEMIVRMKVVTPAGGTIELSPTQDPDLFKFAKVGLGSLGVVSELTLQCVPQHQLLEKTYVVTDLARLRQEHHGLLRSYRHVRYMWLPYTDSVVVVVSNPYELGKTALPEDFGKAAVPEAEKLAHVRKLLLAHPRNKLSAADVEALGFTELRDALLDLAPLDAKHVARVNAAEAAYWRLSQGYRLGESTKVLGFDCGGQQWVLEVAHPMGRIPPTPAPSAATEAAADAGAAGGGNGNGGWLSALRGAGGPALAPTPDIDFVDRIRRRIRQLGIAAPCPIEQRWTASSTAAMSPASSADPQEVFNWVGIIMYLPPGQSSEGRAAITKAFDAYVEALEPLYDEFGAFPHWAKIEVPGDAARLQRMKERLWARYPVEAFNLVRKGFDPKGILSNATISAFFDEPPSSLSPPPSAQKTKKNKA